MASEQVGDSRASASSQSTPRTRARSTSTSARDAALPTTATTPKETPTPDSSLSSPVTARRSLAHQPRLLGLAESNAIELHGLGIVSKAADSPSIPLSSTSITPVEATSTVLREGFVEGNVDMRHEPRADTVFSVDDDDDETLAGDEDGAAPSAINGPKHKSRQTLAPIRLDSYAGLKGYQIEQSEQSAILQQQQERGRRQASEDRDILDIEREAAAYDTQKDDDMDDEVTMSSNLHFEPTTAREKWWMWISVALVVLLTMVSVAIAVDWIDWPGDGIGKD